MLLKSSEIRNYENPISFPLSFNFYFITFAKGVINQKIDIYSFKTIQNISINKVFLEFSSNVKIVYQPNYNKTKLVLHLQLKEKLIKDKEKKIFLENKAGNNK